MTTTTTQERPCPRCSKPIHRQASKCLHCWSTIEPEAGAAPASPGSDAAPSPPSLLVPVPPPSAAPSTEGQKVYSYVLVIALVSTVTFLALSRFAALTDKLELQERTITALKQRIADLQEADTQQFARAAEVYKGNNAQDAIAAFAQFVTMFPASPLAREAQARIDGLREKLKVDAAEEAAKRAEGARALRRLPALVAKAADAKAAASILNEALRKYPYPEVQQGVDALRAEIQERLEKETRALESKRSLGVEIMSVKSYWTVSADVLEARQLLIPYLRITVKNVGSTPITQLVAKAAFEKPKTREMLGDGSHYVLGTHDPPLKPGYTKEVFFGSTTGYIVVGNAAFIDRPEVTADLYLQTDKSDQLYVGTIKIVDRLNE